MPLKENIKTLRERLALTQAQFAQMIGTRQATVTSWETGKASPGKRFLHQIKDQFGVSLDWLVTDHGVLYINKEGGRGVGEGTPYINKEGEKNFLREPQAEYQLSAQPDPIYTFAKSISQLKDIYDYGDQAIIQAIESNLAIFSRTVKKERDIQELIAKNKILEDKCRILESRLAAIEAKLVTMQKPGTPNEVDQKKAAVTT
jgi:transcriptional regulator with XRE-family HTH domain